MKKQTKHFQKKEDVLGTLEFDLYLLKKVNKSM